MVRYNNNNNNNNNNDNTTTNNNTNTNNKEVGFYEVEEVLGFGAMQEWGFVRVGGGGGYG